MRNLERSLSPSTSCSLRPLLPLGSAKNSFQLKTLRKLANNLVKRVDPDHVKKTDELWPGGHIRIAGNQWLRAAYSDSGLSKIPRENSFRSCIERLITKKHLRSQLSHWLSSMCHIYLSYDYFPTCQLFKSFVGQQRLWKDWRRVESVDYRTSLLYNLFIVMILM